jgi:hypothetical protein
MEDLHDLAIVAERHLEKPIAFEEMKSVAAVRFKHRGSLMPLYFAIIYKQLILSVR